MLSQYTTPSWQIFSCGDLITFHLEGNNIARGTAYLRTNLGRAAIHYDEIIQQHEQQLNPAEYDWYDLKMTRQNESSFTLTLPLIEVGIFAAKAWFQPENETVARWVEGDNIIIKVEPPNNICANSIYSLFVRQFGPNRAGALDRKKLEPAIAELDSDNYAVIPPSGTFRDVIEQLPLIIDQLQCDIIQLLPIHPVPTTYARMGRFGSPFAALDYFGVDPALAQFDEHTTPFEQFIELVDAVHSRDARIFLDIPVNHTGWASLVQQKHPEWFVRNAAGDFESPGAWGVVWSDLCKLDYSQPEVCRYMAEVFLFWCRHGVDGFRCDAGYMVPQTAWRYICAKVRKEFPETIFLLEGLGGLKSVQQQLLASVGLNWAYSELFQNYDRPQIEYYLPEAITATAQDGIMINFAETHDNSRLAAISQPYAMMRCSICALLSANGTFGFSNGVEWFATEQIDVHQAKSLNWGAPDNQIAHLRQLNLLLKIHPAFHANAKVELLKSSHPGNFIMARRCDAGKTEQLLIVANLSSDTTLQLPCPETIFPQTDHLCDLMDGKILERQNLQEPFRLGLAPLQVMLLSDQPHYYDSLTTACNCGEPTPPAALNRQRIRHQLLKLLVAAYGEQDFARFNLPQLAEEFLTDPIKFCGQIFNRPLPPITVWRDGYDQERLVMIPPGNLLLITAAMPFYAAIKNSKQVISSGKSLRDYSEKHFLILFPAPAPRANCRHQLELRRYRAKQPASHTTSELLLLGTQSKLHISLTHSKAELQKRQFSSLAVNRRGGMSQMPADWGTITSKYDAILAANCHPDYPVDRQVMFTACRGWLVHRDYSFPLTIDYIESFTTAPDGTAIWHFLMPAGQGKAVALTITRQMATEDNAVKIDIKRRACPAKKRTMLADDEPITIILRPDIEDRCNHTVTKAYTGPEQQFPAAVTPMTRAFSFNPSNKRQLTIAIDKGEFVSEPEWRYMINLPLEAERGLEDHTDLFSPGYFKFSMNGGNCTTLTAVVNTTPNDTVKPDNNIKFPSMPEHELPSKRAFDELLGKVMLQFIVKRDQLQTVIAGYPWFLDWGRDTLICLRGMIAAGHIATTQKIIQQFASYEQHGTIPNMIRGNDDSNRDTSDAPLWLFTAVNDFIEHTGSDEIMQMNCNGRSLLEVLESIATAYRDGTPNGIRMAHDSGLIFSPSHFTWMDTNYPAGTPRQGYPIEIAALWFAALQLISRYQPEWSSLQQQVQQAIINYFWNEERGYFSDCLHCDYPGDSSTAIADDACRPNQLFTITLGAVTDSNIIATTLRHCEPLLVPGALRSLAPDPVKYPLPIYHHQELINNPLQPYWGHYLGDEDSRRKPAYHNGTAWVWQFPTYCEALLKLDYRKYRTTARALLYSAEELMVDAIPGQLPEIIDGDYPHHWRGCPAQAWSITEFYRLIKKLT